MYHYSLNLYTKEFKSVKIKNKYKKNERKFNDLERN